MIGGLVKKVMGGCASKPNRKSNNVHKREKKHFRKRRGNASTSPAAMPMKRPSHVGGRVGDFPLPDCVPLDFEKGAPATCRKSDVSNKKFHHSHSTKQSKGMFFLSLPLLGMNAVKRFMMKLDSCVGHRSL